MASHAIHGQPWPNGTLVTVYDGNGWSPDRGPSGDAITSATVSSGSVTFSGLTEDVKYVAYAAGSGKTFLVGSQRTLSDRGKIEKIESNQGASGGTSLPNGGADGQVLTKQSSTDGDADWETLPSTGHVVEDEGTPLTQRANMNFTGAGVSVADTGGKTVVTIPGGGGGGGASAAVDLTVTPAGGISATNAQAALEELDTEKATVTNLNAHVNDTSAAHAASAISYGGGTGMSATDVEAALDELATEKANAADVATDAELTTHTADETAVHGISNANLLIGYNLFNGSTWPSRPDFNVVLWMGGGGADDPVSVMSNGDVWFPSEA
jgi:hypothetical protein